MSEWTLTSKVIRSIRENPNEWHFGVMWNVHGPDGIKVSSLGQIEDMQLGFINHARLNYALRRLAEVKASERLSVLRGGQPRVSGAS